MSSSAPNSGNPTTTNMSLIEKHRSLLDRAIKAIHERIFYAAYPEHPKAYGEDAPKAGEERFRNYLNKNFEGLKQGTPDTWAGEEVSPYTQQPLGTKYPLYSHHSATSCSR